MSLAALALGLVPAVRGALAAASVVSVPCNTAALVTAIDNANSMPATPTTLDLARSCPYTLWAVDNTSANGSNGLPVIVNHQLTINGRDAVIRRGAFAPRFRILEVGARPSAGNLTLNDVTISGGDSTFGGGILNGGRLTVNRSEITRNTATATGGSAAGAGVENFAGARLALNSVRVTHNTDRGEFGAGGGIQNSGTATVTRSVISFNSATGRLLTDGGGIDNEDSMVLSDSLVTNNAVAVTTAGPAVIGGGINNTFGTLTVMRSQVTRNTATAPSTGSAASQAEGGGIGNSHVLSMESSSIDGNTATTNGQNGSAIGGGIFSAIGNVPPQVTLERTSVSGNAARCSGAGCLAAGGGIWNLGPSTTDHSSVSRNTVTATGQGGRALGGGIFTTTINVVLKRTELAGDAAHCFNAGCFAQGGGIWNDGPLSADHSPVGTSTVTATGAGGSAQGGGIFNNGNGLVLLLDGSDVTRNVASAFGGPAQGGGIFNDAASSAVHLSHSVVVRNRPNNCAGPGTPIAGCTG
jgi:hypothetical protein